MNDPENLAMYNGALIWFDLNDLKASEGHSSISTEKTLPEGDDGYHYRPEPISVSFLSDRTESVQLT
jgi:hypothetical protein